MGPKLVHLIRHAQAQHNVGCDNFSFPDALLTPTGRDQCRRLCQLTLHTIQPSAQLVVSSPLRRTLQTTLLGFPSLIDRLGGPSSVVVLPSVQENGSTPADTGSSRDALERFDEFKGIDFSPLDDLWNSKTGFWATDPVSLRKRAGWTRQWLADRPEQEIVLVSHGGALRFLTEEYDAYHSWDNTEVRTYLITGEPSPHGGPRLQLCYTHQSLPPSPIASWTNHSPSDSSTLASPSSRASALVQDFSIKT